MAANTPNKGWPYPTGTDFVVDGDNAIRAVAEALDARMGMYVVTPTSVSGGTINSDGSVTVNQSTGMVELRGVFTTRFRTYRIEYDFQGTASAILLMRYMTGTTIQQAASAYTTQNWAASGAAVSAAATTQTYGIVSSVVATLQTGTVMVYDPLNATTGTRAYSTILGSGLPGGGGIVRNAAALEDGVAFQKGTGTTVGWIKVYGM